MNTNGVDRNAHKHKQTMALALLAQHCLCMHWISNHDGFVLFHLNAHMFISLNFTFVVTRIFYEC